MNADARIVRVDSGLPLAQYFDGMLGGKGLPAVTIDSALGVPAVLAAVHFLSSALASLPIEVHRRRGEKIERMSTSRSRIAFLLRQGVNDATSSFGWRQHGFSQTFTGGRWLTTIERDQADRVRDLWHVAAGRVTVRQDVAGMRRYHVAPAERGQREKVYAAKDVIDMPFLLRADGVSHYGPISLCRDAIALAIASTEYGARFFANGGVPPFAITGNFESADALARAQVDLDEAVRKASKEGRQTLALPRGLDIKPLGANAEDSQLIEAKRFCVEEIGRIFALPPQFLGDYAKGNFANVEQQDLNLIKHTLRRWIEAHEAELNLKLFGRNVTDRRVAYDLEVFARGDFLSRITAFRNGIQGGIFTPNESRERFNLSPKPGGDDLMIQGATVPIAGHGSSGDDAAASEGSPDDN